MAIAGVRSEADGRHDFALHQAAPMLDTSAK